MTNAKSRDARAGWTIYRDSPSEISIDDLNQRLGQRGFNPISGRTFSHYRKLAKYGYRRYVPINQLDVETLTNPVWDTPLRNRYRGRPSTESIRLTLGLVAETVIVDGQASSISPSDLSISFQGARVWATLSGAEGLEGSNALVTFIASGSTVPAIVDIVELDEARESVEIQLSFLAIIPAHQYDAVESIGLTTATLTLSTTGGAYFADVMREISAIFQAIDSARLVCDEVVSQVDSSHVLVVPPPELISLRFGSPLTVELLAAIPIVLILRSVAQAYVTVWKGHQEGEIDRQRARALRIKNDRNEARHRVEQLDLVKEVVNWIDSSRPADSRIDILPNAVDADRIRSLIRDRLLFDVESIFDEYCDDFEIADGSE